MAVKIKNLVKNYDGVLAVNHLDLNVPEGSIYGFLGPNGAGKTTTLKMIVGMTEPTEGEIEIFGNKLTFGNDSFRDQIGFLPDVPGFYDWMTAKEFLEFSGSLYHLDSETLKNRIKELLDMVGLSKNVKKKIGEFSRGMKQRLGIAQALINNPKIILLDEPVSALDPMGRKEVMDIIGSLAGKVTVFFSSHILADVERVCDRVVIIKDGVALLEDSIEHIREISQSRTIEIEFENIDTSSFASLIENSPWLESIKNGGKRLLIQVNNLDQARLEISELIYKNHIIFKKFTISEATLEDIFIKVVNGDV
ncbi:MAG: ABC transporter ATP-binding protein [Tenericutes bacterium HGW-Tenericutes-1]|nr:MAG: ABC transporter ATP-binding protein [Tenericutes bacterium HGW-Tenericutes-1]